MLRCHQAPFHAAESESLPAREASVACTVKREASALIPVNRGRLLGTLQGGKLE